MSSMSEDNMYLCRRLKKHPGFSPRLRRHMIDEVLGELQIPWPIVNGIRRRVRTLPAVEISVDTLFSSSLSHWSNYDQTRSSVLSQRMQRMIRVSLCLSLFFFIAREELLFHYSVFSSFHHCVDEILQHTHLHLPSVLRTAICNSAG